MPITSDIIDRTFASPHGEAAYQVAEKILDAGEECYWVGGATRDMLLRNVPQEIDMTTSALPEKILTLFPKSDDTAKELGAVIVSHRGHTFEITTFREDDAASDGRHPESVKFGTRDKDARRRDATINAIYWNPVSSELYDPCNGEGDLSERLVRFIGDPDTRIKHDALRILRMVRLRAVIDGQYEPESYKALRENADLTKILSGMRILQELEKLLKGRCPQIALEDLFELSVLKVILPELFACKGIAQPKKYHLEGDVWEHLKQCTANFLDDHGPDTRIAALFHDIGKPETFSVRERIRFDHHAEVSAEIAGKILKRLMMPLKRSEKIQWIICHHMMMGTFQKISDERKAHWYFHPWFQELLQVCWLDIAGTVPADFSLYEEIIKDYNEFLNSHPRPEKPLLRGEEVMEILGTGPGERIGKALQELHKAQVQGKVRTKKDAEKFIREHLTK